MIRLSRRIASISESMTIAISSKAKAMKAEGIDVVDFGVGEPDFDTPLHIKQAAIEAISQGYTKYTPTPGSPELREAVVQKLERDNGLDYDVSQVILSCGAKHSLFNIILATCQEGDEVIVPTPYWVSYPEMVKAAGAECIFLPTDEPTAFKISPEQLANAITPKSKLLILNSPANPTGSVYTQDEFAALAGVVLQTNNLCVLSDEIYETLLYEGAVYAGIGTVEGMYERTIVVNGFSKSYAMTGWRLGYAAGPKEVIKAAIKLQSHSTTGPCSISQKAGLAALTGDQTCVAEMREEFDRRRDRIVAGLNAIPGVTCVDPRGAFYALPNVSSYFSKEIKGRKIHGSMDFAQLCLEKARIAVVPGCAFGDDRFVRFSYATSVENINEGLDRLSRLLQGS
jgi:aspartate aminotransferase